MKKILIAIDYHKSAQKVAELGYAIGKAMNTEILLIHVIENVPYYSSDVYDPIIGFGGFMNTNFAGNDILRSIELEATQYLEKTRSYLNDFNIGIKVCHGDIYSTIIENAAIEKCDLIVIGAHTRKWIEEILLDSTAHKLFKKSKLPLVIIPVKNEY